MRGYSIFANPMGFEVSLVSGFVVQAAVAIFGKSFWVKLREACRGLFKNACASESAACEDLKCTVSEDLKSAR